MLFEFRNRAFAFRIKSRRRKIFALARDRVRRKNSRRNPARLKLECENVAITLLRLLNFF